MSLAKDENSDALLEEAMDWLLRLREAPGDPADTPQFRDWLSRSPAHVRAWDRAQAAWELMGEVPPAHAHIWQDRASPHSAARRAIGGERQRGAASRRPGKLMAGALAIAATGLLLLLAAPSLMLRMEADYRTATGESRSVTLPDGTVITLGADSAIASDFGGSERRVKLLSGEAFFDVVHDAARPFVVDAEGVGVTVLGTAFNVQLTSDLATVELQRGAVRVAYEDGKMVLAPGEAVAVDRHTGAMARNTIASEEIAAWRSGYIFVSGATIASVVEQLQRYHSAWITVPDGALAAQRVTGLYDVRDPDRALRAIVQPYGGHVREISPYLRVLSRF